MSEGLETKAGTHDVFVSYSSKNKTVADAIVTDFEAHGIRCWYAPRDIGPGEQWAGAIVEAIKKTTVFVFVYTRESNKSSQVLHEIDVAESNGKTIVPLVLTDEQMRNSLAYHLAGVHWLDAVSMSQTQAVQELRLRVGAILGAPSPAMVDELAEQKADELAGQKTEQKTDEEEPPPHPPWKKILLAVGVVALVAVLAVALSSGLPGGSQDGGSGGVPAAPSSVGGTLMSDVPGNELGNEEISKLPAFGSKYARDQIVSVTFLSSIPEGLKAEDGLDVSASADGTVLAWFEENAGGLYDLTIAADGPIAAPEDCYGLFRCYNHLRSVYFKGAFDTSGTTNMGFMFNDCSALSSIDVSGFDTSSVTDMKFMFNGCSALETLDVSGFVTSAVTNMQYMFGHCSKLETLDVSGFDTSGVRKTCGMFGHCSKLETLDVSGFDTSSVTDMGYMFSDCDKLASIDVSGFVTSVAIRMDGMFTGCSSLATLDVSDFNTSSVTDMAYMFYNCSSLTSLDVSGFDISDVTNIRSMFFGCSSLKTLDVSHLDTSSVTNTSNTFYGISVKELDLRSWDVSKVEEHDNMLGDTPSSLTVYYPASDEAWAKLVSEGLGGSAKLVAR